MDNNDIISAITEKYQAFGENPQTYLKGLLHAKPMNYWDYVEVDTLLSLQKTRTDFKDEEIFIIYHQITELVLKLIMHEVKQMVTEAEMPEEKLINKFHRLNRYAAMLITSFDVMRDGMDYDDYNTFRLSLAPASGFQSAQFRRIELYCTPVSNLINESGRGRLPAQPTMKDYFEHIYWKDAGLDRKTGKKTLTLQQFEDKYLDELMRLAETMKGKTLEERVMKIQSPSTELKEALRKFDHLFNVEWPMVHLNTARHYLDKKGETKAATGGSEWKKYLHPQFQQRKFFPAMWTGNEIGQWGQTPDGALL